MGNARKKKKKREQRAEGKQNIRFFLGKQRCFVCGMSDEEIFRKTHHHIQCHHVKPRRGKRSKTIGYRLGNSRCGVRSIIEEMKKCIPVCQKCHTAIHKNRGY